jgi:hypothetical protein
MLTLPGQILKDSADWIGATNWFDGLLFCTFGYLAISKILLLRKSYVVLIGKKVVRHAATPAPRPQGNFNARRHSPETVTPTRRNADNSGQPITPNPRFPATTPDTLTPELAALDWTSIDCQNEQGCARSAAYVVEYHAVDHCLDNATNSLGNIVELLCGRCLAFLQVTIAIYIDRLISQGRDLLCLTCGKPLLLPEDIIKCAIPIHETVPTASVGTRRTNTSAEIARLEGSA